MPLYRVVWKSDLSGASGAASGPLTRYLAEFRAAHQRLAHPHMTWRVEPVPAA